MPPRSFYIDPRISDYLAYAEAFFPEEGGEAQAFAGSTGRPYIRTSEHLASYIGVSSSLLRQIQHKPKFHYRTFDLTKENGEKRIIFSPRTYLKVIQWWILDNILATFDLHDAVHGFRQGRGYVSNAMVHLGAKHVLNIDIERFFPSITQKMVDEVFRSLGYNADGAAVLTTLTTLNGEAPTGAPTSPMIGNIVLTAFDRVIADEAKNAGFIYTRYADDLTFSSKERIGEDFRDRVFTLLDQQGFKPNLEKTKFMGRGQRMEVTGLVINQRVTTTREWRNWARGYLHRVRKNPADYIQERSKVAGVYGTLKSVDPSGDQKITKLASEAFKALNAVRG